MAGGALLGVARALSEDAAALGTAVRAADPGRLVTESGQHGLSAVVSRALDQAGEALPPPHGENLRRNGLGAVAKSLRVKALLLRTLDALAPAGVVPILLKGPGLSARLYGDPVIRETTDVDLLLSADDVPRSVEVLERMGLSLDDHAENYYPPRYRHHWSYGDRSGLVELHFRAMSAFGTLVEAEEWVRRSRADSFEGRPVRFLSAEDELVYLALHAASHMLQRIAWLLDLKLLVRTHPGLDWSRVLAVARESRLPFQVYFAFDVARRLLGMSVPPEVLAALRPTPVRRLAGRWFYEGERISRRALDLDKGSWVLGKLLMTDSRWRLFRFLSTRAVWELKRSLGLSLDVTDSTDRR